MTIRGTGCAFDSVEGRYTWYGHCGAAAWDVEAAVALPSVVAMRAVPRTRAATSLCQSTLAPSGLRGEVIRTRGRVAGIASGHGACSVIWESSRTACRQREARRRRISVRSPDRNAR